MRFTMNCVLAGAALAGSTAITHAQPISGLYVSGGFGAAFPHSRFVAPQAAPSGAPASMPGTPAQSGTGGVGQGSVGYGFGNGLRFEMEGTGGAGQLRLPHWP